MENLIPYLTCNGAGLFFRESGSGDSCVVFSHGFLMDHAMFDAQMEALSGRFRCLAYDHRGQGQSEVTDSGYDIDALTEDAAAFIRASNASPCHFVGLSMGGFVGLRLAIRYPELLKSLILLETSADAEPLPGRLKYGLMRQVARWIGFGPLIRPISRILFGSSFRSKPEGQAAFQNWSNRVKAANREGLLRTARWVIGRSGVNERLAEISVPVLVVVGEEDKTTPLSCAELMVRGIQGAQLAIIDDAGHSSTIEQPGLVSSVIMRFLQQVDPQR